MALIAKSTVTNRDKEGNLVEFKQGEEIKGLDKKEAARLIDLGVAEEGKASQSTEEDDKKK
ncbi:hypothetical protein CACET_c15610 [Clostridium aceticum]|uniref:Uncharacterized protein n=1 Tax=Clostridium aceticum TaxID=84022 RepID=A0A0D8IC84_9CLOT|nr:hypothetical protein [Clostridium aceticum]AKL95010.1 hypothetical protein CACET_c15610 [Clostridium aceticum]KJF27910.1 hypothetical protein TZ02_04860 [Clostridium aceticum]